MSEMLNNDPGDVFSEKMGQIRASFDEYCEQHSDFSPSGVEERLFRNIFGAYPCYRENCGKFGHPIRIEDPDMVQRLFGRLHQSFSESENDLRVIKVADLDFSKIIPEYHPKTRVYLTSSEMENGRFVAENTHDQDDDGEFYREFVNIAGMTIMQVVERFSEGAPADKVTFYMWPGGIEYYKNQEMNNEINEVASKPRSITFDDPYDWAPETEKRIDDGLDPIDMIG